MRGGLDETLARLARREEALRRRVTEPTDPAPGRRRANEGGWRDPVKEVVEAVGRVVAAHPGTAVALRVEHDGQAYPLRVAWSGGSVTVSAEVAAVPPPVWPMPVGTVPDRTPGWDGSSPDPAARLAELIRRDPSLLSDLDPHP
ncbi:hypothetical protein [Micromonospora deserti]|uniref:Uncharacterized protein n=1 Tax=Micromonospora deserti TaxID=2070366 RepID=A0A2W2C1H7_9ACTN|nr:hypothetical protein [Micromonospora deserti]PZF93341.1 hypothetical protein C1I99_20690 [Micromonospora deserti]